MVTEIDAAIPGGSVKPIHTYEVTLRGFPPVLYSARSTSKARMRCFRDYGSAYDATTFKSFLKLLVSIRRVPDPPGVGERILVAGLPATRVYQYPHGQYVWFMRDDSDDILCSHPLDVTGAA